MSFYLKAEQCSDLSLLRDRSTSDIIELCKSAFECLINGPNKLLYQTLAKKYNTDEKLVEHSVDALIALLIDATKANVDEEETHKRLHDELGFNAEALDVLAQFVTSKRNFVAGSIKSANIRAQRLVNMEWRLEVRVASRSLLRQSNIFITMKLYLHTEPKNENRDLLEDENGCQKLIHSDERRNRKDILVQTDLSSLSHIIQTLEEALQESKSRRIRNIVDAIH